MVFRKWTPLFDVSKERMDAIPIWVHLAGLPSQYWSPTILQDIGNSLLYFLKADMSFLETGDG